VEIEMPMVISLVCAVAGNPGNATDAAITAADRQNLFIDFSLGFCCSVSSSGHVLLQVR
jgi:hypothetical protein